LRWRGILGGHGVIVERAQLATQHTHIVRGLYADRDAVATYADDRDPNIAINDQGLANLATEN